MYRSCILRFGMMAKLAAAAMTPSAARTQKNVSSESPYMRWSTTTIRTRLSESVCTAIAIELTRFALPGRSQSHANVPIVLSIERIVTAGYAMKSTQLSS